MPHKMPLNVTVGSLTPFQRQNGPTPMSNDSQQIVNKAWNFAHVLRDDGLSYMAYTEQITFLLFLKMADEQTQPPYNKPPIVPVEFGW